MGIRQPRARATSAIRVYVPQRVPEPVAADAGRRGSPRRPAGGHRLSSFLAALALWPLPGPASRTAPDQRSNHFQARPRSPFAQRACAGSHLGLESDLFFVAARIYRNQPQPRRERSARRNDRNRSTVVSIFQSHGSAQTALCRDPRARTAGFLRRLAAVETVVLLDRRERRFGS